MRHVTMSHAVSRYVSYFNLSVRVNYIPLLEEKEKTLSFYRPKIGKCDGKLAGRTAINLFNKLLAITSDVLWIVNSSSAFGIVYSNITSSLFFSPYEAFENCSLVLRLVQFSSNGDSFVSRSISHRDTTDPIRWKYAVGTHRWRQNQPRRGHRPIQARG